MDPGLVFQGSPSDPTVPALPSPYTVYRCPCWHSQGFAFLLIAVLSGLRWVVRAVLIPISMMVKDVEHFSYIYWSFTLHLLFLCFTCYLSLGLSGFWESPMFFIYWSQATVGWIAPPDKDSLQPVPCLTVGWIAGKIRSSQCPVSSVVPLLPLLDRSFSVSCYPIWQFL